MFPAKDPFGNKAAETKKIEGSKYFLELNKPQIASDISKFLAKPVITTGTFKKFSLVKTKIYF